MQEIAIDDDEIRVLAFFDRTDAVIDTENPCGIDRDRRIRGQSTADGERRFQWQVHQIPTGDTALMM